MFSILLNFLIQFPHVGVWNSRFGLLLIVFRVR